MQRTMLKSKIHRVHITEACLEYEGSLTVDKNLLDAADMLEYEQVEVYNIATGDRFRTYVINGEPGSGVICLNGAAARKGAVNDLIIICSYVVLEEAECRGHRGINILADANNRIAKVA